MSSQDYLHGYAPEEQRRLVAQAEHWRHALIPVGLAYEPGDRVLEIGCGAGAVLAVLAETFPGIRLAGIDREESQIAFARAHLESRGIDGADLRVGDARELPWEDGAFDRVFVMWVLEHVPGTGRGQEAPGPLPLLREALRVMRPGGTIALTETDYATFLAFPSTAELELLARAQYEHFAACGDPIAGRRQGNYLVRAGFEEVVDTLPGFHYFQDGSGRLQAHVEYIAGFLEPALERMAARLDCALARLRKGIRDMRAVADHPDGAMMQLVHRAHARRPG